MLGTNDFELEQERKLQKEHVQRSELKPLLAVYDKYKHLDSVLLMPKQLNPNKIVGEDGDPFHFAACEFWKAIKRTLNR